MTLIFLAANWFWFVLAAVFLMVVGIFLMSTATSNKLSMERASFRVVFAICVFFLGSISMVTGLGGFIAALVMHVSGL